jgi:hypothetical protein
MRHSIRAAFAVAASAGAFVALTAPNAFAAAEAAHSGANPGHLLLELVGGPGDHC